jgi:hypothetical protein
MDKKTLEHEAANVEQGLVAMDTEVVDIDMEAERLVTMVKITREALQREITETRGWPPKMLGEAHIEKLEALTKVFNTVTQAVNRLDVTRERRAKKMKKKDFLEAATNLIKALPNPERGYWLKNMIRYHRRSAGRAVNQPGQLAHTEAAMDRVDRIPKDHDNG